MKKIEKIISNIHTALGSFTLISFAAAFYFLEKLRPKMIRFQTITPTEENKINIFGVALLSLLVFCLASFYKIVKYLKNAKKISLYYLFLFSLTILSLVFIFGDLALINDIGKQHKYGLAQPEWFVLYPVMAFQFISTAILTHASLFNLRKRGEVKYITRDANVFTLAQWVGLICGLLGLTFTTPNFGFPRPLWMIKLHVTATTIFLLIPYILIISFWFVVKIKERPKQWYDEKQIQDIGKSAFFTLIASIVIMTLLFVLNFNAPEGLLSVLWFPFYIFLNLLFFSSANLYFGRR